MNAITPAELKSWEISDYLVIDTRPYLTFCDGFIEGAISVPYSDTFTEQLSILLEEDIKVLVVAEEAELKAVAASLKLAGHINVQGYLKGGYNAWVEAGGEIDLLIAVEPDEFAMDYKFDEFYLLDLRPVEEFKPEHIEDAENIELAELERSLAEFDLESSYYLYGNTAEEAVTGASLFKMYGYQRVRPVAGTFEEIKAGGVPVYKPKKNTDKPISNQN